jgi:hypothetical protein
VVTARLLRTALFLALSAALAACSGDEPEPGFHTVEIEAGDPVAIGVSTMLEGELSSTGQALLDAAVLAGEGVSTRDTTSSSCRSTTAAPKRAEPPLRAS